MVVCRTRKVKTQQNLNNLASWMGVCEGGGGRYHHISTNLPTPKNYQVGLHLQTGTEADNWLTRKSFKKYVLATDCCNISAVLLVCVCVRGANHSLEISYTLARNPIVLQEIPNKSFCFNRNLVRFSSKWIAPRISQQPMKKKMATCQLNIYVCLVLVWWQL